MAGHDTAVIFLSARVRAVLLRGPRVVGRAPQRDNALRYADLVLDDERHLVSRGDTVFDLSPTEYVLLRYLMQNPERVLSKTQILDHVWRYDFGGSPSVVETFVSLLRKKLNAVGPPLIQTVRGFGYVLRAQR